MWSAAMKANGWLTCDPAANRTRSPEHDLVWTLVGDPQTSGSVSADALRHACHRVALGHDKSSKEFHNADLDVIYRLFELLSYPVALSVRVRYEEAGDDGRRRRLVKRIRDGADEAYIDSICRDKFVGKYNPGWWEDLPVACLQHLAMTISERTDHWRQPISCNVPNAV
jgi:hypothetical protein